MNKQVRIFLNELSGAGGTDRATIARLFEQHGCGCAFTVMGPKVDLAVLSAREPEEVAFIAAGGDGTVNAVANAVAGTGRKMGVLPVGTLNHFAKDLGLPLELERAVEVAAGDQVRRIDAAEVNGIYFVNNSSLGMYPRMVVERERMKRGGWNKWASLAAASMRAWARFKRLDVEVEMDGKIWRSRTPFLFVGNNEYCLEGTRVGSRPRLDENVLSLFLAPGVSRGGMLRLAIAALFGRARQEHEYESFRAREFNVSLRRGKWVRVSLDGEVRRLPSPLHYRVCPGALQVLCAGADRL